ncbi:MAG: T9SS type A sorting domain-containing protein, partial [Ignavibacteria bacterium]|nr:T9SS type A sorting domain-containing protein [Ignavibacteria bacterium]
SSLTTNGGVNWTQYTMPAGGCGAGMIVPGRDYIVAAECSAILKLEMYTFGPQNIEEGIVSNNVPDKYALYQNYPNPFNPSTEIKFDVLKTGNVNIKVYDETGKNIMTLTNGIKNPGTYSVKFDASSLSSGLYYYVMETEGTILSKKMVLVK